jgi:hypothetical protein
MQKAYAVVATTQPQLRNRRNRPTPYSQPSQPTDATFATNKPTFATVATDHLNCRNRVLDKCQIIG